MNTDSTACRTQIAVALTRDDPIGALENLLAIVRRSGLELRRLSMQRDGMDSDASNVVLDLDAPCEALVDLVVARFGNLTTVSGIGYEPLAVPSCPTGRSDVSATPVLSPLAA